MLGNRLPSPLATIGAKLLQGDRVRFRTGSRVAGSRPPGLVSDLAPGPKALTSHPILGCMVLPRKIPAGVTVSRREGNFSDGSQPSPHPPGLLTIQQKVSVVEHLTIVTVVRPSTTDRKPTRGLAGGGELGPGPEDHGKLRSLSRLRADVRVMTESNTVPPSRARLGDVA